MYTKYGPFYYATIGGLFRLARWSVTHDAVRWLTLAFWLATAAVWGWCAWLWGKSIAWSIAVFAAAVTVLRVLAHNLGHPQILVVLLYAVGVAALSLHARAGKTAPLAADRRRGGGSSAEQGQPRGLLPGRFGPRADRGNRGAGVVEARRRGGMYCDDARPDGPASENPALMADCLLYTFSIAAVALCAVRRRD